MVRLNIPLKSMMINAKLTSRGSGSIKNILAYKLNFYFKKITFVIFDQKNIISIHKLQSIFWKCTGRRPPCDILNPFSVWC